MENSFSVYRLKKICVFVILYDSSGFDKCNNLSELVRRKRRIFQLNNLASSYYFVFTTKPMTWGLLVMINTNLYLSIAYALFFQQLKLYIEKLINKYKSIYLW